MKRRRAEIQVMSVSFLDVICCALGGVLLLLLYTTQNVSKLTAEVSGVKEKAGEAQLEAKQRYDELFGKLGELETKKGDLEEAIPKARELYLKLDRELGTERVKRGDAERELKDSRHDNQKFKLELGDANKKLGDAKIEIGKLREDNRDYKTQLGDADKKKGDVAKDIGKLREENTNLKLELGDAKKKLGEVEVAIGRLRAENTKLTKETGDADKKRGDVAKKTEDLLFEKQKLQKQLADANQRIEEVEYLANGVVTLRGKMKNVVFVFDTSHSLKDNKRFREYTTILTNWVKTLRFETFGIIEFDNNIKSLPASGVTLLKASPNTRLQAAKWIENFVIDGQTFTEEALEKALTFENVDTIVLFTDGRPTNKEGIDYDSLQMEQLLQRLKVRHGQVTINTIGIGDYMEKNLSDTANGGRRQMSYGEFLQDMARNHNGAFLGF